MIPPTSATDWVALAAETGPDRIALICGGSRWTYGELSAAVDAAAAGLAEDGVRAGDRVGVGAARRVDTVVTLWAVWRLGAVAVVLDPAFPSPPPQQWELATVVSASSDLPLRPREGSGRQAGGRVPTVGGRRVSPTHSDNRGPPLIGGEGRNPPRLAGARHPSLQGRGKPMRGGRAHTWVPTAGSTGEPKAVVLTDGNVAAAVAASQRRLGNGPDDHWLLVLPLFHVGGLSILWRSAATGGATVIHEKFDAEAVAASLVEDVTLASLVPTMLQRVLDVGVGVADSLRAVLVGGAAASPRVLGRALDAGLPVLATYGATEACSQIATVAPGEQAASVGTVGEPLDAMEVAIVDGSGAPVGPGEVGEITVSGAAVSPGYALEEPRSGPHRTGDLGRWEGSRLVLVGRLDDLIVTGGENVAPQSVEQVLAEHPDVDAAVVYGTPDPEWGEVVCATVAVKKGRSPTVDDLDAHARSRLRTPERPRRWRLVDQLPLLPNGKVDRALLRAAASSPGRVGGLPPA